ncbi:efflux RND transporter permease subunit [Klebsiella quasipneumoniae]|uniref:efflux RND transporter permease subunit n=1 Tax=Klebsiella quasipneumoniae TaxID=1463165 RepID=UPI00296FA54B|nr:efflux RND transporter permease subunit [Klebsiella quasipneumoniae]
MAEEGRRRCRRPSRRWGRCPGRSSVSPGAVGGVPAAGLHGRLGGVIYQQFSLSLAVSILFSGFLALTFTPALCATLLKPIPEGHHEKTGFFGWFNRKFTALTGRYTKLNGKLVPRAGRVMFIYRRGGADGFLLPAPAGILRAGGRPGLHDRRHPVAARRHP